MAQRESFYSSVSKYYDRAARSSRHPHGLLDFIKTCNSVYRMRFPVRDAVDRPRTWKANPRLPVCATPLWRFTAPPPMRRGPPSLRGRPA